MRGCRDPSRAVDVEPDVALVGDEGLAGVDPHPHLHRAVCQRSSCAGSGRDRVGSAREGDEEGVALRVDLDAVRLLEGRAERSAMRAEQIGVGGSVLTQQPRRAGDIGEEKGDGPGRKSGHLSSEDLRPRPRPP